MNSELLAKATCETGQDTEDPILEGFKRGDEQYLEKVYAMFSERMLGTAIGILHNEKEAEEVILDAFFKIWMRRERFATMYKLQSYLFVVVKHSCFQILEKRKAFNRVQQEIRTLHEDREGFVLERIVKTETVQYMYHTMKRLPEASRTLLHLMFVHELSTEQIAEKLQITREHVRVRKSRALRQLRSLMLSEVPSFF